MNTNDYFREDMKLAGTSRSELFTELSRLLMESGQIRIDPHKLIICSVYGADRDHLQVIKMDAASATFTNLCTQIKSRNRSERNAVEFYSNIEKREFYNMGLNDRDIEELFTVGVYFEYEGITIFLASRAIPYLVRVLKLVSFEKGINPMRDMYIASTLYNKNCFYLTVRHKGSAYKAFYATTMKNDIDYFSVCMNVCKHMLKTSGIISWEITHYKTEICFKKELRSVNGISFGTVFQISDMGEHAITLSNCLFTGETIYNIKDSVVLNKSYSSFDVEIFLSSYDKISDVSNYMMNLKKMKPANRIVLFEAFYELEPERFCGRKLLKQLKRAFDEEVEKNDDSLDGYAPLFRLPEIARSIGAKDYIITKLKEQIEEYIFKYIIQR